MQSFHQFLNDAANRGEAVNTVFEERLFELVGILHRITDTLTSASIPHEVIGGLAVLIYIEEADSEQTSLTRDVDLLVNRSDLDRVKVAAAKRGFRFRHVAGVDMLIFGDTDSARNAVHLIFSGEKVRSAYSLPAPPIAPELKHVQGKHVMVISLPDLVLMKLTSHRLKDQVHVKALDDAGLITRETHSKLPSDLRARLDYIRAVE